VASGRNTQSEVLGDFSPWKTSSLQSGRVFETAIFGSPSGRGFPRHATSLQDYGGVGNGLSVPQRSFAHYSPRRVPRLTKNCVFTEPVFEAVFALDRNRSRGLRGEDFLVANLRCGFGSAPRRLPVSLPQLGVKTWLTHSACLAAIALRKAVTAGWTIEIRVGHCVAI